MLSKRYLLAGLLLGMLVIAFVVFPRPPRLRLEPRTYGYDFVDESNKKLATANTLEEIEKRFNDPAIIAKLAEPKLRGSVEFYHISPNVKGYQVPSGVTLDQIVTAFDRALSRHGKIKYDVNDDNW